MAPRLLFVALLGLMSVAAEYQTKNFNVSAPTPALAKAFGDKAEYWREKKAQEWLGQEMPTWGRKCPLVVKVTMQGSGGATSFAFDRGRILSIEMNIEGTVERMLESVLPHEVTHTVFAYNFRQPVPRWADEGGSVLSEDDLERGRHDKLVREIINSQSRRIPLRRLFALTQYPPDVMVLYAEGFSVTSFLVGKKSDLGHTESRKAFLAFVGDGMRRGWDEACRSHYGYQSVEQLEGAWLKNLSDTRGGKMTADMLAGGRRPEGTTVSTPTASNPKVTLTAMGVTRTTLPPAMPRLGKPEPVYRGVPAEEPPARPVAKTPDRFAPANEDVWANPTAAPPSTFPSPPTTRPAVRLGAPVAPGAGWSRPTGG